MNPYLKALYEVYLKSRSLQSDFARQNAKYIAEAASRRHITSILAGIATNRWYITASGLDFLKKAGWLLDEDKPSNISV